MPRALRVGICCFGYGLGRSGGVQVYTRDLIAALERFDVSGNRYVLLLRDGDDVPPVADRERFTTVRLRASASPWMQRLGNWTGWGDPYSRHVDALHLDVVHYPATRMGQWSLQTPVVLTFFDMQQDFYPRFFPFRERPGRGLTYPRGVRKAAVVIAPSEFTAKCLIERYRTPPGKIERIPVGVGQEFSPVGSPGERERLVARYRLPRDGFLFYPANPWPHKNHERLFRASRRPGGRRRGTS